MGRGLGACGTFFLPFFIKVQFAYSKFTLSSVLLCSLTNAYSHVTITTVKVQNGSVLPTPRVPCAPSSVPVGLGGRDVACV